VQTVPKHRQSWFSWFWNPIPAYALAALLAVFAVQQRTVTAPEGEAQLISPVQLRPATRGVPQTIRVTPEQTTVQVSADVTSGLAYTCMVTNAEGDVLVQLDTPVLRTPQLSLLLPARQFREGRFRITVRSRSNTAAGNPEFEDQFEFTTQP
jgi:hypothetical protein